jgi:hypothetical protein
VQPQRIGGRASCLHTLSKFAAINYTAAEALICHLMFGGLGLAE